LSVFTHLTPTLQTGWIGELTRVLKPAGHLILSTHGTSYRHRLTANEAEAFDKGQLVVKNNTRAPGSNTCAAYHPFEYVQGQLAQAFEIRAFVPEGAKGNPKQDLYVLRKR